jgi:hypothetical protein
MSKIFVDSNLGKLEKIFGSSRIYLCLSAPFRIPSETTHLQKTLHLPPGPSIYYLDLPLFQHLPRPFSILPIPSSDHQSLPSTASVFLELSAILSIFHSHSVTFRVFLPLSGSTSNFLELSETISIFDYHSVTSRVFLLLPGSS